MKSDFKQRTTNSKIFMLVHMYVCMHIETTKYHTVQLKPITTEFFKYGLNNF